MYQLLASPMIKLDVHQHVQWIFKMRIGHKQTQIPPKKAVFVNLQGKMPQSTQIHAQPTKFKNWQLNNTLKIPDVARYHLTWKSKPTLTVKYTRQLHSFFYQKSWLRLKVAQSKNGEQNNQELCNTKWALLQDYGHHKIVNHQIVKHSFLLLRKCIQLITQSSNNLTKILLIIV